MIGLLGAKIWKENRVDFANPINLVPLAAGIIIGIGNVTLAITDTFSLSGIALGTIVAVAGWHLARALAPAEMKASLGDEGRYAGGTGPALGNTGSHGPADHGHDHGIGGHRHEQGLGGSDPSSLDARDGRTVGGSSTDRPAQSEGPHSR
jgi:hypothetical protein